MQLIAAKYIPAHCLMTVAVLFWGAVSEAVAQTPHARVTSNRSGRIRAYQMQSAGQHEPPIYESGLLSGQFLTGEDIVAGDFDNDGDDDYAAILAGRIRIYDGVPSSGVEQPYWEGYDYGDTWGDMAIGDFNNDMIDDIAAHVSGRLRVWYAPGQKAQQAGEDWWTEFTPVDDGKIRGLSVGDFNNDTNAEIAMSAGSRVRIWEPATQAAGSGEYWASNEFYDSGAGATTLGVTTAGDFLNTDGKPEVAAYAASRVRVWDPATQLGDGTAGELWFSESYADLGPGNLVIGSGDFNGDNNDEIMSSWGFRFRAYEPQTQESDSAHGWYSHDGYYPAPFVDFATTNVDDDANLDFVTAVGGRIRAWEPNDATPQGSWDFRDNELGEDPSTLAAVPDNGKADQSWDGGAGAWSDSRWNSGGPAPTANEDAFITNGGTVVTISGNEAANSTLVIDGAQLRVSGTLAGATNVAGNNAVTTSGTISGGGAIAGNLTNHGLHMIDAVESLDVTGLVDIWGAELTLSSTYAQTPETSTGLFTLLTAGRVFGAFETQAGADLGGGYILEDIQYGNTDVMISIMSPSGGGGLDGDYNNNGTVDAADYVLWRDNLGTNTVLPNDSFGGVIGQNQYDQWKNNFGATVGSGSAAPVPEPTTLLQLGFAIFGWAFVRPSSRPRWFDQS